MLGLPNLKIAFNSLNTSISISFSKEKKDYEKKEIEDDASENETDGVEKIFSDYYILQQQNEAQFYCILNRKNIQFLKNIRIDKHYSFDILIPPPETV